MGCCGCTLQTSAIVAAVFGIIQSVTGFITGIAVVSSYYNYPFASTDSIDNEFDNPDLLFNTFLSATIFNGFWLIATVVLIIGIVKENATMHRVWVGATSMIMVVDLIHSIVFVVGIVKSIEYSTSYYTYVGSTSYGYSEYTLNFNAVFNVILFMTLVARTSIWLWIVNICLTIYTAHRANEIERGPVYSGQTVMIYGNQPTHTYAAPGQTIVIQHGGTSTGMPPTYDYQPAQYGQQPPTQYGSPPVDPPTQEKGLPSKY